MTSVARRNGAERAKAPNRSQMPAILQERPAALQALFERDYEWAANHHPDPRVRADIKKGGRKYAAAMWLAYYDTIYSRPRRRKGPDECHDPRCTCKTHGRNRLTIRAGEVKQLAEAIDRHGPEYA